MRSRRKVQEEFGYDTWKSRVVCEVQNKGEFLQLETTVQIHTLQKQNSSVLWSFTSLHITNRNKRCRRLYIKQRINTQKTNLDPEKTTPRHIQQVNIQKTQRTQQLILAYISPPLQVLDSPRNETNLNKMSLQDERENMLETLKRSSNVGL